MASNFYLERGWHLLPVHGVKNDGSCECGALADYSSEPKHAIGKHPYDGQLGHRTSSIDPLQIYAWRLLYPNANMAIATGAKSNLIVVDLDANKNGFASLHDLEKRFGELPKTPMAHSGGGGRHFYFSHPGFEVRGRRGMLPGIDIQADGGRIVAPPSKHKSGRLYLWDNKQGPDIELAELPRWLLNLILAKQSKRKDPKLNFQDNHRVMDRPSSVAFIQAGGSLLRYR